MTNLKVQIKKGRERKKEKAMNRRIAKEESWRVVFKHCSIPGFREVLECESNH